LGQKFIPNDDEFTFTFTFPITKKIDYNKKCTTDPGPRKTEPE